VVAVGVADAVKVSNMVVLQLADSVQVARDPGVVVNKCKCTTSRDRGGEADARRLAWNNSVQSSLHDGDAGPPSDGRWIQRSLASFPAPSS
jgi:hypothetical protein